MFFAVHAIAIKSYRPVVFRYSYVFSKVLISFMVFPYLTFACFMCTYARDNNRIIVFRHSKLAWKLWMRRDNVTTKLTVHMVKRSNFEYLKVKIPA